MIQASDWEKEQIKNGNMEMLVVVIKRADKHLTDRCKKEKNDIRHIQGQAHYSDELCKILGIED